MTKTTPRSLSQAAVARNEQSRARPRVTGPELSRGISNAELGNILHTSRPHTTSHPSAALSVQRAPTLDPAKVAAAADQAKRSNDAAQLLNMLRFLSLVSGPFGMAGVLLQLALRAGMPVGVDSAGNPVMAHVIPGQIAEVAMVVAGVHGSEQSGVEVAERLLKQLDRGRPFFTVVVVPQLFPGNVASRAAWEEDLAKKHSNIAITEYQKLRDKAGDVGRITKGEEDPNRQFPDLGKDLDLSKPVDAKGRIIEPSNLALLALIKAFKPSRIVSIHAVKDLGQAGIYADPHPSVKGFEKDAKAKEADELALAMAKEAERRGANVRGNKRGRAWSSLYPGQDPKLSAEQIRRENAKGRTLGQWGPSQGITVITVEVGEQHRSGSAVKDPNRAVELEAEASVIREIFLGPPLAVPSPTPAKPPAVPVQPVQRMLVAAVAKNAGNQAAARLVQRFRR
jgi:hypothetical protein